MRRTAGLLAMIGVMSSVVTALAQKIDAGPSRGAYRTVPERSEPVIRPPASIPSSRVYPRPVVNSRASSMDRHAAEFLRWKEHMPIRRPGELLCDFC
jgi:hypothetical protein